MRIKIKSNVNWNRSGFGFYADRDSIEFKDLGKKKLAYPIKKEVGGNYFLITAEASHDVIREFDRKIRIDEIVLRHLIIKLDEE